MKQTCNIIQDLLPLYADNCCSEDSRRLVEEHLAQCESCREIHRAMTGVVPDPDPVEPPQARDLKQGLKKLRRRLLSTVLALTLLLGCCSLGWKQIRGTGIHLTNLNEYRICTAFLRELEAGDLEEAYSYFDMDVLRRLAPGQTVDLEAAGLAQFLESGAGILAEGLTDCRYLNAWEQYGPDGFCRFYFTVTVGQKVQTMQILCTDRGIQSIDGGNGSLPAPDALTQLCLWSEYLWQELNGCYWDPETRSYVYFDNA